MTKEELKKEIEKAELRVTYLYNFIECDHCKNMVHMNDLGQSEHWATLCKNCVVDEG